MGIGFFPLASRNAHAGLDPSIVVTPTGIPAYPPALGFDAATRDFAKNADGSYMGVDTVDAGVALALGLEGGAVTTAPTFGQRLRSVLNRVAPSRQTDIATQEVTRVLARWIDNEDIALLSVTLVAASSLGQFGVSVRYTNLRTPTRLGATRPTTTLSV